MTFWHISRSGRGESGLKTSFAAVILLVGLFVAPAMAAPMTVLERQRLIAHLEMTGKWLIDEVSDLSTAQLEFRPSRDAWNILEVVEHLIVVGPIYWEDLQKALKAPAATTPIAGTDAEILWYGIDRTRRQKAIAGEEAKKELRNLKAGLDTYRKLHERLLEYARTTKDDLRSHIVEREKCDAYQWLLLISTHEQRHILQIREIKASPDFPHK
jgi:hypothetical protein